ncbi:DUF7218 family protein [Roseibium alexandrii]|uniref:Rho termination factor n=1 Tax=Roseibium alexandrii (strain DSM 17067 / NCIMB 14079 / DFL-11) TaxID=244592 RepID=A0A5E8H1B3_ROSAD|nr:hypothetical protein [Roseibium alexandrii]EEE45748.1 hypothetical protein SADFL11_3037 [Roseibium alexandrii DFL-11]
MSSKDRPSIKDEETYDALRREGYGKSKAARIANAQANEDQSPSKKDGSQPPYEDWTKEELYERARELEIEGRSEMSKDELTGALRD